MGASFLASRQFSLDTVTLLSSYGRVSAAIVVGSCMQQSVKLTSHLVHLNHACDNSTEGGTYSMLTHDIQ